jgi:hypothetical protein
MEGGVVPAAKRFGAISIGLRAAGALAARRLTMPRPSGLRRLYLCIADHYEPRVGGASSSTARARVIDWTDRYGEIASRHRDADGRPPQHTFFYPWDEHDPWELARIADLCERGCGEVELHLHHQDDTSDSLRVTLREALAVFRDAGCLSCWPDGRTAFGFVHGNWALDNSRIENGRNFCGVNDEIRILAEEGCYADFTFPAWPQTAQPRLTNTIYYATDDPARPKSHDGGRPACAGRHTEGDLLLVQGPLAPFITGGFRRSRIAMDDGDLAGYRRYSPQRLDRWIRAGIHVSGRPDCLFVKLHCHGCDDASRDVLLGTDLEALFADAESRYNDGVNWSLHYVTARETYNVIRALELGANPSTSRDLILPKALTPPLRVQVVDAYAPLPILGEGR